MAPQVQLLREIRDNQLMNTEAGSANSMKYTTHSHHTLQTWNVKIQCSKKQSNFLTPMLSSLAIMQNADSESEVLGLGLSVIALNLGMYIGLPAFGILKVIQLRRK